MCRHNLTEGYVTHMPYSCILCLQLLILPYSCRVNLTDILASVTPNHGRARSNSQHSNTSISSRTRYIYRRCSHKHRLLSRAQTVKYEQSLHMAPTIEKMRWMEMFIIYWINNIKNIIKMLKDILTVRGKILLMMNWLYMHNRWMLWQYKSLNVMDRHYIHQ